MKLQRLLANLGYGSRKDVTWLCREGRVTDAAGEVLYADDEVEHAAVRIDGAPLDPAPGMVAMLHKTCGTTCSHDDAGPLIYDTLPPRWRVRRPPVSSIGRLDRDTSGLLLLTDDGALLHRIIAPRQRVAKTYVADLAEPIAADTAVHFASGQLMLRGESTPLLPAALVALGPRRAQVTVHEGRYHQVRRMFAACGNHVTALQRIAVGTLPLGDLAPGAWRLLDATDIARIFDAPAP